MYNPLLTVSAVADNKALYAEFAAKAEEFIYSSLPTTMAVKVAETQNADKNHPGRKITTWIFRSKNDTIRLKKPTKFGLHKHSANGTFFDIKLQDNKIVWIKPHVGSINESWSELLTPKGMSFGDTNTSSLFLLLSVTAF